MVYYKTIVCLVCIWFIYDTYSIECPTGVCSDIANAIPNPICNSTSVPDTYECQCKAGYYALPGTWVNGNTSAINYDTLQFPRQCQDINECENPSICAENSECVNTPGSYECICKNGFVGDYAVSDNRRRCYDVNECAQRASLCPTQTVCVNTFGSYICICGGGNQTNPLTGACEDVNECVPNGVTIFNNPCDRQLPVTLNFTTCINTIGSFQCVCPDGYLAPRPEDFYTCRDLDECSMNQNNCSVNSICNNFGGGFNCTCKSGYSTSSGGVEAVLDQCSNINECSKILCLGPSCFCMDTPGSYFCGCSDSGYNLQTFQNGSCICVDVDECYLGKSDCDLDNGNCINLDGGFNCNCNPGYVANETGFSYTCLDENECITKGCYNSISVNATCFNEIGCFTCTCPRGYTGNGYMLGTQYLSAKGPVNGTGCNDLDECLQNPCAPNENCTNTIGSYNCFCDPQFFTITEYNECQDIDECALGKATCPKHSTCQNKIGGYTCVCDKMYSGQQCEFDGYWSEWQNIGNCSVPCGSGVVQQVRSCLLGSNCNTYPFGYNRTRICNTELCSNVTSLVKSCWCENVTRFLNETELQEYSNQNNVEVNKNKQAVVDIFNKWTVYPIDEVCFISKLNNSLTAITSDISFVENYASLTIDLKTRLTNIIHCNANMGIRSALTMSYREIHEKKMLGFSLLNEIRSKRDDLTKKMNYCLSSGFLNTLWNSVTATFRSF
ncbi:latent-transforming growth factor beta-binding protein 2 isoform X2 [Hydra vulgaris]|uniref:Latent-transforming growth factor beta-binding protein 2 isoform X2 n=1 Tax=Hydra vulgaris TaxID=6087 RepID=A0ABM4DJB3_HYDVU